MDAREKQAWQDYVDRSCDDITTLRAELAALREERTALRAALTYIARWELPTVIGRDGQPSTYGAEYGSNGERDYMRSIAQAALRQQENGNDSQ